MQSDTDNHTVFGFLSFNLTLRERDEHMTQSAHRLELLSLEEERLLEGPVKQISRRENGQCSTLIFEQACYIR